MDPTGGGPRVYLWVGLSGGLLEDASDEVGQAGQVLEMDVELHTAEGGGHHLLGNLGKALLLPEIYTVRQFSLRYTQCISSPWDIHSTSGLRFQTHVSTRWLGGDWRRSTMPPKKDTAPKKTDFAASTIPPSSKIPPILCRHSEHPYKPFSLQIKPL